MATPNIPIRPASVLDAIIAASEPEPPAAAPAAAPPEPAAAPPAAAEDSTRTPQTPDEPAAPGLDLEAKRALVRARFLAVKAERETPKPPAGVAKPFHCPICLVGSLNRQGIVSHLRQIHHMDKAARDSAMRGM